jgi:hypothetical protein
VEDRKFKVGYVAYEVKPKDDGGLIINRYEVQKIGWTEKEVKVFEMGEEVRKEVKIPIINAIEFDNPYMFMEESKLCLQNELPEVVLSNLNRKKLW